MNTSVGSHIFKLFFMNNHRGTILVHIDGHFLNKIM